MRTVTVLHLLWKNVSNGVERFLLRPHATWAVKQRHLLAPLTKKVPVGDNTDADTALRQTLADLHGEHQCRTPLARLRLLPALSLRLRSPAQGVETDYRIFPVTARCPSNQRKELAAELGGVWLTRAEALVDPLLSPTARVALNKVHETPAGPLPAHVLVGNWTERLLYARDHDARAFGPLFQDMTPYLRRLLRRLLHRPDDRDDVLAETALLALANLDAYEPLCTPAAWMGTILHNTAISLLRRRGVYRSCSLSMLDNAIELADNALNPAELAEEAEQLTRGWALLHEQKCGLTITQRVAWVMRYNELLSYREIAAILQLPIGTLATWFHQVKINLERQGPQRC